MGFSELSAKKIEFWGSPSRFQENLASPPTGRCHRSLYLVIGVLSPSLKLPYARIGETGGSLIHVSNSRA